MGKKKILVVDDEQDFLRVLRNRLESMDYEVVTASNGNMALGKIKTDKPDAVLLDIMMPILDGIQTLKEIRKTDKTLPVFMLTASSDTERFKSAKDLNASGFIIKTGNLKIEIDNITNVLNLAAKYKGKQP